MNPNFYKWSHLSIAAALMALFGGCTVLYDAPDALSDIKPGATKVQVSAALGAPTEVVVHGDREAWLYCRESAVLDRFILAVFKGTTLDSVKQQTEFDFGACEQFFEDYMLTRSGG